MHSADDVDFMTYMKKRPKYLHSYTHELVHVPSSPCCSITTGLWWHTKHMTVECTSTEETYS